MRLPSVAIILGTILTVSTMSATVQAQYRGNDRGGAGGDKWEQLGCVNVEGRSDRDVIQVGRKEGPYTAIQVFVTGNDVSIEDLNVIYGNGQNDDIKIRNEFREGSKSRQIDLKGDIRAIQRIIVVSKKGYKGRGRGIGRVCISGLEAKRLDARNAKRRGDDWEQLGCQRVGFNLDKDTIRVGRKEGSFKKLRLHVSGSPIYIANLSVVYGNGTRDDLRVKSLFKAGSHSGAIDLKGGSRVIRQIDMLYNATPGGHTHATVCISGLQ